MALRMWIFAGVFAGAGAFWAGANGKYDIAKISDKQESGEWNRDFIVLSV